MTVAIRVLESSEAASTLTAALVADRVRSPTTRETNVYRLRLPAAAPR